MIGVAASSATVSSSDLRGVWVRVTLTTESVLIASAFACALRRREAAVFGERSAASRKSAEVALRRLSGEAAEARLRDACLPPVLRTRFTAVEEALEDEWVEILLGLDFLLERSRE